MVKEVMGKGAIDLERGAPLTEEEKIIKRARWCVPEELAAPPEKANVVSSAKMKLEAVEALLELSTKERQKIIDHNGILREVGWVFRIGGKSKKKSEKFSERYKKSTCPSVVGR